MSFNRYIKRLRIQEMKLWSLTNILPKIVNHTYCYLQLLCILGTFRDETLGYICSFCRFNWMHKIHYKSKQYYSMHIQSERLHIYHSAIKTLLHNGWAYPCFCTPRRLEVWTATYFFCMFCWSSSWKLIPNDFVYVQGCFISASFWHLYLIRI